MSIELSDTRIYGSRPSDLPLQLRPSAGTLFAVHRSLSAMRTDYGQISSDMRIRALSSMHVGSMAFEETWEYSPSSHTHYGCTNVQAEGRYGARPDGTTAKIATLSAGNVSVDTLRPGECSVVDIYCYVADRRVPEEPAYGTLRFAYSHAGMPEVTQDYVSSYLFDGWVYPDGFSCEVNPAQFAPYSQATGTGNAFVTRQTNPFVSGGVLSVPNLSDCFFSLNPAANSFRYLPAHMAVAGHSHHVDGLSARMHLSADAERSVFKTNRNPNHYDNSHIHGGCLREGEKPYHKKLSCMLNLNNSDLALTTSAYSKAPIKTWPRHWAVPVMIYVGGRIKEYDAVYV